MPDSFVHPRLLSDAQLDVLAEAYKECNGGVTWLRATAQFVTSSGYVTRSGRSLVNCGLLRVRPGAVVWLPQISGAGRHPTDEPGRVMEITPAGVAALRARVGPGMFRELTRLRDEDRARRIPRGITAS